MAVDRRRLLLSLAAGGVAARVLPFAPTAVPAAPVAAPAAAPLRRPDGSVDWSAVRAEFDGLDPDWTHLSSFLFVSHRGDVQPSGFLPIRAGNVRHDRLADVYRLSPLFRDLRATSKLEGKCGACEFREVCGGSRARSYAASRNYLAEDPACAYQPRGLMRATAAPADTA